MYEMFSVRSSSRDKASSLCGLFTIVAKRANRHAAVRAGLIELRLGGSYLGGDAGLWQTVVAPLEQYFESTIET